jgi:type I restriction enzyme M protein
MQRRPLEKFATVIALEEIAGQNDHNLNISRYVDATEPSPQMDVRAELAKLRDLETKRNAAEQRMNELLKEFGYAI